MPITKTPQILQRCVSGVSERLAAGGPTTSDHVSRAFAICTAQGQRYGKYQPGTRTLTPRGRGITAHLGDEREPDFRRFERTLRRARASGEIDLSDLEPSQIVGAVIGSVVVGGLLMHAYRSWR